MVGALTLTHTLTLTLTMAYPNTNSNPNPNQVGALTRAIPGVITHILVTVLIMPVQP